MDPARGRSSMVAWVVAALAVGVALVTVFSHSGSPWSFVGGFGSGAILAALLCPVVMGGMMWSMMRGHTH